MTEERVGPRDYMPQWGDLGGRLEDVHKNFDVYMLGKLLWCMIAGKLKLPREYFRRPAFDLSKMFNDPHMKTINTILDKCVAEDPANCLPSAQALLPHVEEALVSIEKPIAMLGEGGDFQSPCYMCGRGRYKRIAAYELSMQAGAGSIHNVQGFACDFCQHFVFFSNGYPQEGFKKH